MTASTAASGTTTPERSTPNAVAIDPPIPLGPLSEPIIARHIADDVVDRLVTAIALGVYVPGQQLPPERAIAAMLGVSRTTVREALKQLTETRYLEVRRGRNGGYFVLADWGPTSAEHVRRQLLPSWHEFEKLFDARTLLEPLIARTAAERRTPADAARDQPGARAPTWRRPTTTPRAGPTPLCTSRSPRRPRTRSSSSSPKTSAPASASTSAPSPTRTRCGGQAITQHQELVAAVIDGDGRRRRRHRRAPLHASPRPDPRPRRAGSGRSRQETGRDLPTRLRPASAARSPCRCSS